MYKSIISLLNQQTELTLEAARMKNKTKRKGKNETRKRSPRCSTSLHHQAHTIAHPLRPQMMLKAQGFIWGWGAHICLTTPTFAENHTHLIKNRLRSRISDINLGRLMHIAIEGPQLTEVNLHQILDI